MRKLKIFENIQISIYSIGRGWGKQAIGRNRKLCDIFGKKCDQAIPTVDVYITHIFKYVQCSTGKKAHVGRMYQSKDLKPPRWI